MQETEISPKPSSTRAMFVITVAVTAALYVVPYGHTIAYPLVLLSTLAHELGHGITAALIGAHFDAFQMWADGSGMASTRGTGGRVSDALIAAGGLCGPAFVACVFFVLGKRPMRARIGLFLLVAALTLILVLFVRNGFGWAFISAVAFVCLVIALKAPAWMAQLTLIFVAVQLALSVFSRGDYLFTAVAQTNAGNFPSDVANMATALFLPFWFWGAACGAFSVVALLVGLRTVWKN